MDVELFFKTRADDVVSPFQADVDCKGSNNVREGGPVSFNMNSIGRSMRHAHKKT